MITFVCVEIDVQPHTNVMTVYEQNGFANRDEYLKSFCDEYDETIVYAVADLLGPNEDFDGLVTTLEDYGNREL